MKKISHVICFPDMFDSPMESDRTKPSNIFLEIVRNKKSNIPLMNYIKENKENNNAILKDNGKVFLLFDLSEESIKKSQEHMAAEMNRWSKNYAIMDNILTQLKVKK